MSFPTAVNANTIQQWVADKMDVQKVQDELINSGLDETSIAAHLSAFKKAKYAKRQFTGFMCMAIGAVLGFISCVFTLTNPIPELYYWFLYGLTSVAISVIFIGLYFVFEG